MNINSRSIDLISICYCWIGIVLFLFGWVRLLWAVPTVGLILFAILRYRSASRTTPPSDPLIVTWPILLVISLIALVWLVISGSGAFIGQLGAADWTKHNAVLKDLVEQPWPVYYENGHEHGMLTYYIGSYLIPALVGKLFSSFRAAELAMFVNNYIGLLLVFLLLLRAVHADTKAKQLTASVIFVFFGTVLFLGQALYYATAPGMNDIYVGSHWISRAIILQYPYMWSDLRWAFPQAITPWIITLLFWSDRDHPEYYLLLAAPLALHALFPLVGLAFLMIGLFLWNALVNHRLVPAIKQAFSVPNLCTLLWLAIAFVYFSGNILSEKPAAAGFSMIGYGSRSILYFCFCATFLCYTIVIFDNCKDAPLFYIVNALLLLLPFIYGGLWNVLCMRASVPAIMLLMVFVIRSLFSFIQNDQRGRAAILVVLLALGAFYPATEMKSEFSSDHFSLDGSSRLVGSAENDSDSFAYSVISMADCLKRDGSIPDDFAYNYFTYDYETAMFYRYFARK